MASDTLILIKILHTIIWAFFASAIFYVSYCGITGEINMLTWVAIGFVFLEALILLAFKWMCPLTVIARKYSDSQKENFDIYLPEWLAKHNKVIFTILFVVALVLVFLQNFS